jgi:hypothetical protein
MLDPDMNMEIGLHSIIVEQRVVDIEQEDSVVHHLVVSWIGGSSHAIPSGPTIALFPMAG